MAKEKKVDNEEKFLFALDNGDLAVLWKIADTALRAGGMKMQPYITAMDKIFNNPLKIDPKIIKEAYDQAHPKKEGE